MTPGDRDELINGLDKVLAFADVTTTLVLSSKDSLRLIALTDGVPGNVHALLEYYDIARYFEDLVSADEIKTYKPDPVLFRHFLKWADSPVEDAVYIAANPFEIAGAGSCGLNTIYIKHQGAEDFDPWAKTPGITVYAFSEIEKEIEYFRY